MSNREAQQRGFIFRSSQPSINYRDIRAFTLQRDNFTEMQTASQPLEFQTMMSECSLAQTNELPLFIASTVPLQTGFMSNNSIIKQLTS